MAPQIWTLTTKTLDVEVFFSLEAAEEAAIQAVQGFAAENRIDLAAKYGAPVTHDNLEKVLEDLAAAGGPGFPIRLKSHEVPRPKLVVVSDDANGGIESVVSDSPLLADTELVLLKSGFDEADYDPEDVIATAVPGTTDTEFVGHRSPMLEIAPLDDVFAAVDAKDESTPNPGM
jgi:hypothetical protein